jgi:hypothetical protein
MDTLWAMLLAGERLPPDFDIEVEKQNLEAPAQAFDGGQITTTGGIEDGGD